MPDVFTKMLSTVRPSRHVKMVWRVANMSATSRVCRARGIWRTTRQTDITDKEIRTNLVRCGGKLNGKSLTSL